MRLLSWLPQGQTGGVSKPQLRSRLTLGRLDERIVPDGTAPIPPDSPPGQEGEPASPPINVEAGQALLLAQHGDTSVYAATGHDGDSWLVYINTSTGAFTSVLADYDPVNTQFSTDGLTVGYQPDATKWSLVWDADTGSWTGIPPGGLTQTIGAGALMDGWNVIVQDSRTVPLATESSATVSPATESSAPPRPGGITVGGITIRPRPGGGVIIEDPFGGRVTIYPQPGGGIQGIYRPPFGGPGGTFQFPPSITPIKPPKPPVGPPGSPDPTKPLPPIEGPIPPLPGTPPPKKDPPVVVDVDTPQPV